MYRFFKNILNTVIIFFAVLGVMAVYKNGGFSNLKDVVLSKFSFDSEKTAQQVGDFSNVDEEFNLDTAVNLLGYKTVVAKHPSSGQKMIIVDSGAKKLITKDDLKDDNVKIKLEDLCNKFGKTSVKIENIEIVDRGYMNTYGKQVPYVKINAKVSKLPFSEVSGIVSVVDDDINNQRVILSINDKKHYSQLITTEFYKNVKDSKIR